MRKPKNHLLFDVTTENYNPFLCSRFKKSRYNHNIPTYEANICIHCHGNNQKSCGFSKKLTGVQKGSNLQHGGNHPPSHKSSAKGLENIAIRQEACQSTTTLSSRAANTNQQSISPRCFDHPRYTGEVLQHVEETSWKMEEAGCKEVSRQIIRNTPSHNSKIRLTWQTTESSIFALNIYSCLHLFCHNHLLEICFWACINHGPYGHLRCVSHKAHNCQGTHKVHLFGRHQIVLFQVGLDLSMEGK